MHLKLHKTASASKHVSFALWASVADLWLHLCILFSALIHILLRSFISIGFEQIRTHDHKIHSLLLTRFKTCWFPKQIRQKCFGNILRLPVVNLYCDFTEIIIICLFHRRITDCLEAKTSHVFLFLSQHSEFFSSSKWKLERGGPSDLACAVRQII